MLSIKDFTIGVEEEYQVVDLETRELIERGKKLIPTAREELGEDVVQPEMHRSQIEIATPVCHNLAEVRELVSNSRRTLIETTAQEGKTIAAAGTHPFSHWQKQQTTPKERYRGLMQEYQQIIKDLVIFGCHVHVCLEDHELAIQTINRARIWLATLLALTANSPFWLGKDTGYDSYRTELWHRLPLTGPPLVFANYSEYEQLLKALLTTEAIDDPTKIYWDVRISEKFPTVEFRVTDICLTVDEAVMMAGLTRALVWTCYQQAVEKKEFVPVRHELLRSAHWQAARYGLTGNLIDVVNQHSVPAKELVAALLEEIRPALEAAGDWQEISALVKQTLKGGNAAQRQRQAYEKRGNYQDVVDLIVSETARGL
ncbi:MAG: carboxylate-amine ligase [Spirulinaceae cyanobacterium]